MDTRLNPGLGELLRYVGELVDQGADREYQAMGLSYRPRYTPIFRALISGAQTVTDITERTFLTQGAVSQSVSLMEADGLVTRYRLDDGRKSGILLTPHGQELLRALQAHWETTFAAIRTLEAEIGSPLVQVLEDTARALERTDFSARLRAAMLAAMPVTEG